MKRLLLILVIFLACDCCWARKLEHEDHFRLDGKRANSFLVHKRSSCEWYQWSAETRYEAGAKSLAPQLFPDVDMNEECCIEGCNAEEVEENTGSSDPEQSREGYLAWCC